jgi:two-component system phosphate regulon sensor histidine kinase PhoR
VNQQPTPVLVIDDEMDIRDACERILTRAGCKVRKAGDTEAGMAELQKEPAWVVLLDLKMPGLGGMDILPAIRERYPDTLVIIITGYATVETAIQAMKLGAYDFIPKPFKPDELRLTVNRAIERRNLEERAKQLELERRRSLADLNAEQSRMRTVIRALPFGVVVTDREGNVALMNPSFRNLAGLDHEVELGRPIADYVDDEGFCSLAKSASSPGGTSGECNLEPYEFNTKDERCLFTRATPIPGEDGDCLGAVLVCADMTAYKIIDQLKSEFVAKVSHELQSPLSTIFFQLKVLTGDTTEPGSQDAQRLLSRAAERTESLISFVTDLLDMSRMESGMAYTERKPVRVGKLLRSVIEGLKVQTGEKSQSLELELPAEPLPELKADPMALESIFTNLIGNAIKYTPKRAIYRYGPGTAWGPLR